MIYVTIDHSHADNYFMVSAVRIEVADPAEKQRLIEAVKRSNLIGSFVDRYGKISEEIAEMLNVDAKMIDLDTEEIDFM